MTNHPKTEAVRAVGSSAVAGVLAFGLPAGSRARPLVGPRTTASHGSVIVGSAPTSQSTGSDAAFRWAAKTGMQDLMKLVNAPQRLILHNAIGVSQDDTLITGDGLNAKLGIDERWRAALLVS